MKKIILFMMITFNGTSFLHGMRNDAFENLNKQTFDEREPNRPTLDKEPYEDHYIPIRKTMHNPSTGLNPTPSDPRSSGNIFPDDFTIDLQSPSENSITEAERARLEEMFTPIKLDTIKNPGKKPSSSKKVEKDRQDLINRLNEIKLIIKENIQEIIKPKDSVREYELNDLPKEFTDGVQELENKILSAKNDKGRKPLLKQLEKTLRRSEFYGEYLHLIKQKNNGYIKEFIDFHKDDLTKIEISTLNHAMQR
jgi:hypothetical protein